MNRRHRQERYARRRAHMATTKARPVKAKAEAERVPASKPPSPPKQLGGRFSKLRRKKR
jgi:hypothetical protein